MVNKYEHGQGITDYPPPVNIWFKEGKQKAGDKKCQQGRVGVAPVS